MSVCVCYKSEFCRNWWTDQGCFWQGSFFNCVSHTEIQEPFLWNFVPKSELRKFSHGPSIILTKYHHQLSSTKVDAWYDQLSTVVGRTKMTILATIDVRPTVLASPSQFIALGVYRCVLHDVRVSASRGSVRDSWCSLLENVANNLQELFKLMY